MRILAIRGRNLASLAGDFEIDFEAPPLVDAGIFAITGPTGAGKSTLLDAVCLALYDEVPRIHGVKQTARIGSDEGITASDRRLLLRHGTAEAKAEVDFLARDGHRYRATWSVKRARSRVDGKLQQSELSLVRLSTGENISGRKTETQQTIEAIIGLTFEQFTRGVLLAQGEFEAFIKAEPNKRADLLERLTGSEIYTRLGQKAWEKASAIKARLEDIRRNIAALNGLDDAQRAAAEAELTAAEAELTAVNARLDELHVAERWQARNIELSHKLAGAQDAVSAAQADFDGANDRREQLRLARKAIAFAAPVRELQLAIADQAAAGLEQDQRLAKLGELEPIVSAAKETEAAAAADHANSAAEAASLAPDIAKAKALDRELASIAAKLSLLEADLRAKAELAQIAEDAHGAAATALAEAQASLGDHLEWLGRNAPLAALAQREAELTDELARFGRTSNGLAAAHDQRADIAAALLRVDRELSAAKVAVEEARLGYKIAADGRVQAEAQLPPELDQAGLATTGNRLSAIELKLRDYRYAEAEANSAKTALTATKAQKSAALTAQAGELQREQELAADLLLQQAQTAEARRALALSEAAADQATHVLRDKLQDGQPCPVCGAIEHKLTALDALVGDHLLAHRKRVAELESAIATTSGELNAAKARAEALQRQIVTLADKEGTEEAAVEAKQDRLTHSLALLNADCSASDLPTDVVLLEPALKELQAEIQSQLAEVTEKQQLLAAARAAEEGARTILEAATAREAQGSQTAADCKTELAALDASIAVAVTERQSAEAALDHALTAVCDWRQLEQPADWLREQAGQWQTHDEARASLAARLTELSEAEAHTRSSKATEIERRDGAERALSEVITQRNDVSRQRSEVLAGQDVAAVERRLATATVNAEQAFAQARQAREHAASELASEKALAEAASTRLTKATAAVRDLRDALNAPLAESGLALDVVEAVVAAGQEALTSEIEALAQLETALRETAAVLAKCRTDLVDHQGSEQPAVLGTVLTEAIAAVKVELSAATERKNDTALAVKQDDQVRLRTAQLRSTLESEAAANDIWLKLADSIGDKEGNVFRRFAQGLTLGRLLEHANSRLADLKPRYTLERGIGGDMLIQVVDNDMGGEVRGLQNLSGGERFLVSLALALGLAEMSTASGVRIESLFIDEGFGALDPASLGQAIALLEHLQASGRRVGVISHVEELKERIPVKIEVVPVSRGTSALKIVSG